MTKTTIRDEAPAHKYFTQMLNMAEDDLDPFQYRLLAHYVRWAGNGQPYPESIRVTAKAVKMSTKKVDSVIDELSSLGYIEVYRPTAEEARNGKTIRVTVLDRWLENINRFQRSPVVKSTQAVVDIPQACSKNTTPPVVNLLRSEEQKEEQEPTPRKREKNLLYDAIYDTWHYTAGLNGVMAGLLSGHATQKGYAEYNLEEPITADELRAWAGWYRATVLNDNPDLSIVAEPLKVQSSITYWQGIGKPNAKGRTPEEQEFHDNLMAELAAYDPSDIIPPLMREHNHD